MSFGAFGPCDAHKLACMRGALCLLLAQSVNGIFMPIKKWAVQYAIALPIIFVLLAGVQYLKGRSLEYSIEFGMLWSLVSLTIFAIRRFYNYRKNINCAVCNDLPNNNQGSGGK